MTTSGSEGVSANLSADVSSFILAMSKPGDFGVKDRYLPLSALTAFGYN
ncbi:MAG: hypothetical protein IPG09_18255 [Ignavibacteria bacterium]|nr:hypothetical protein [Ignavibacteria bacterium]